MRAAHIRSLTLLVWAFAGAALAVIVAFVLPITRPTPEGFVVKGIVALVDPFARVPVEGNHVQVGAGILASACYFALGGVAVWVSRAARTLRAVVVAVVAVVLARFILLGLFAVAEVFVTRSMIPR